MKTSTRPLRVTFDLELPEDEICSAELELIEAHFADWLRQVLTEDGKEREASDGCSTLRKGLDNKAG